MAAKEPCRIGSTITVSGNVSGDQDLVVEGRIEGKVGLDARLVVEDAGVIEAEVEANELEVKGNLRGDMVVAKTATFHPSAHVAGNIRAAKVLLMEGVHFSGSIEMDVELPPEVNAGKAARA